MSLRQFAIKRLRALVRSSAPKQTASRSPASSADTQMRGELRIVPPERKSTSRARFSNCPVEVVNL